MSNTFSSTFKICIDLLECKLVVENYSNQTIWHKISNLRVHHSLDIWGVPWLPYKNTFLMSNDFDYFVYDQKLLLTRYYFGWNQVWKIVPLWVLLCLEVAVLLNKPHMTLICQKSHYSKTNKKLKTWLLASLSQEVSQTLFLGHYNSTT